MMRLSPKKVPTWNARGPGLPFPGKWPTRWYITVRAVGVDWRYLGKPSREVFVKLARTLRNARGHVTVILSEFDRTGRVYYHSFAGVMRDPVAWLTDGKTFGAWNEYHAWDQKNLSWSMNTHKTVKLQTDRGVKRFYLPHPAPENWQGAYKTIHRRQLAVQELDPHDF